MIEIELDGRKVQVAEGSMIMHAADRCGTYIPHFCYHKKLSIAANCRMCLVDIEKAPKPMPACATPVTQGMVVRTRSEKAIKAQQSVMEFLLINHPLDCPICDQGGECQLQDLAVGYGGSSSRYTEQKRVVMPKDVGPLVAMDEMSRCIHCTRCIRFGQEVAGVMELGMIHRGEHSEITVIAGDTIDSELSGNMIDICPVGALTSKPFRYSARTWELSRRKSISPHDSTGANLIVQVKSGKVMRVVPLENEDVNECWIADRDRFSYEALNSDARLTAPMIKQGGEWKTVSWTAALEYVARSLTQILLDQGAQSLGALGSATSTVEELHLLTKLMHALGSHNVDYRTRHCDFSNVAGSLAGKVPNATTARWLGTPIASLSALQRALVVGSFLRKDHPLFAQRLRQAARKGGKVHSIHSQRDDWLMSMAPGIVAAPSQWLQSLAEVAAAIAQARGLAPPLPGQGAAQAKSQAQAIAESLLSGQRKAVLLGNAAAQHPQAAALLALADWIGEHTGASVGYLTEAANTVGAQLVGAVPGGPGTEGLNAGQMLGSAPVPLKALLCLNVDPLLDAADPAAAATALRAAEFVVAMSPLKLHSMEHIDVLLPIAPFTETSGTFINAEGRAQSFHGVVKCAGDARPGWKVLRVLGNLLELSGFEFETSEDVRQEALGDPAGLAARLNNTPAAAIAAALTATPTAPNQPGPAGLERVSDVPIYCTDALVRHASSLQLTADARPPVASLPAALWAQLGLEPGAKVRVRQGAAQAVLPAKLESTLAPTAVRIPAGHPDTVALGAMFGAVSVESV
ncbi:MAG: NADH-quinone oxidoreductase subunit NuoG [Burkholderiaceae bacterium]